MHHEQDIRKMGGLKKYLPTTHWTFLVACIAIAGIPPLSGFFSKDEILAEAFSANKIYWIIGVLGAVMTAFYMFRLYGTTFLGTFRGTPDQEHHLHESPKAMTWPLIVLAVLSAVAGFAGIPAVLGGTHYLAEFLSPVFAGSVALQHAAHPDHSTEYMLMGISAGASALAILYAVNRFSKKPDLEDATGLGKVLENKWYVDELYDAVVVKPLRRVSVLLNNVVEKLGIDGMVNGVGKLVNYGGRQLRLLQNGQVGAYILMMVVAALVLLIIQLFVL
jgi:NADH-quinone oxidoreductase subunit L